MAKHYACRAEFVHTKERMADDYESAELVASITPIEQPEIFPLGDGCLPAERSELTLSLSPQTPSEASLTVDAALALDRVSPNH
jgi:hypothetical protein